ncbi:unnamed protein product [Lactuca virosa]|uniref:Uncharacterized protein n=1 Tax=Lactuca virosa TaxID=75947 RepID=A0AAU9MXF5_9ASTR|nr:unnamed protein product [Lactuca virosa]
MASILKGGRLTLALIILIVISSSSHIITTTATARTPYNHVRQLATNCDYDPIQQADGPGRVAVERLKWEGPNVASRTGDAVRNAVRISRKRSNHYICQDGSQV